MDLQGSVLDSLLFDIYILFDLFYLSKCTEECNFAGREVRSFISLIDWKLTAFLLINW